MSSIFTDKELQIASQLAYFSFTDLIVDEEFGMMSGNTLHSIFANSNNYIFLYNRIMQTRKFDIKSGGAWDSREHATLDLMNFLANPEYNECVNEDNNAVNWSEVSEWKIVDIKDRNDENGFYAVTFEVPEKVCLLRSGEARVMKNQANSLMIGGWLILDF